MQKQNFEDSVASEKDALDQSTALIKIVRDLLDTTKRQLNYVYIILGLSILVNIGIVGGFLWYESQFQYALTEETSGVDTIQQEVSGENSKINNVEGDQYTDSSVHNSKGGE